VLAAGAMTRGDVLFHSPCFDGIVSAVLVSDFLASAAGWSEIRLQKVNYDLSPAWLERTFDRPTAVVDFLYHPAAAFWADHHRTTFLSEDCRRDFEKMPRRFFFYDRGADSCAGVLWRGLQERFSWRAERYATLVQWAEKLDAARYESVEEAILFVSPAAQISVAAGSDSGGLCESLVRALSEEPLESVAARPEVQTVVDSLRERSEAGLERLRRGARMRGDIIVFDVAATEDVFISRYAPYALFPDARYSIGVVRGEEGAKITAMRNPWREFESVPLGDLFARFGGGGHQRVASLRIPAERTGEAGELVIRLADLIETADTAAMTSS